MRFLSAILISSTLLVWSCNFEHDSSHSKSTPGDMNNDDIPNNVELATLGGGCFWCTEAVYQNLQGVYSVTSGYSGGTKETADYKLMASGQTKHAEVIQIKFDPAIITFEDILEIFWSVHDPTTLNRQGNDVGPQYRSVIFYHNNAQKNTAEQSIASVATEIHDKPIVTEIAPFEAFYEAESYHQDYYKNVGDRNPYCTFIITPKVTKLKKLFSDKLKQTD